MDHFELPKVELHAHLNGSLSNSTLIELHKHKYGTADISSTNYKIFEKELLSMAHCFGKFKYAHDLTNTPERLAIATRRVIEEFADENAIYLELRSTPRKNEFMSKLEYVSTICETIYECSEKRPEIMVKYLPSIDRAQSVAENQETLDIIIQLLEDYSSVIVGLDLSGNPSSGNFNDLKPILSQARREGLRLAVHCSEIAGRVEETREVLEFGVDRIGHGTFLDETPELWKLFQAKRIFVECCLSSNVKCGTVATYNDHHMQKLIRINNPIAICTDDYGVFDTTLTKEFELAKKSFALAPEDIEKILKDSVKHAFCNSAEKATLMNKLHAHFRGKKA